MKKTLILPIILLIGLSRTVSAQEVNYDESKIAPYTLEDPLTFTDGRKVNTPEDWQIRRSEILDIFQSEMYGRFPEAAPIYPEIIDEGVTLAGFAIRRQIRMWFDPEKKGQSILWLILLPTQAKGPVPAIISLNYSGNHSIIKDEEVVLDESIFTSEGVEVRERGSGYNENTVYPVEMILARGYAFVTACYRDISPDPREPEDQEKRAYTGIFELWGPRNTSRTDNTTSLGAWAWALCRGLDMLEAEPAIDASKVMVTGCSRLAKAALLAGAFDQRFAVVAPIQTGGGGIPIAKRNFGENVTTMTRMFTHWYCRAYRDYAGHEDSMPFDQHLLAATIAPRALLVGGFNENWFDTKGEFLSLEAASPVWEKFCGEGLPKVNWPDNYDRSAIGKRLGYYRRENLHGISAIDWTYMIDFADRLFF